MRTPQTIISHAELRAIIAEIDERYRRLETPSLRLTVDGMTIYKVTDPDSPYSLHVTVELIDYMMRYGYATVDRDGIVRGNRKAINGIQRYAAMAKGSA